MRLIIDSSSGGNGDIWMRLVSFYAISGIDSNYTFEIIVPPFFKQLAEYSFGDRLIFSCDKKKSNLKYSKPGYDGCHLSRSESRMSTLLVSSKGQIVLPAALRRRLGMGAGAKLEVLEEQDGLKLRVVRSVATADVARLAGMVQVPARGVPRRLADFDPASLVTRPPRGAP
jgi:AbrB family looped-hinge helix DNA binding protein